ncbi:MAG: methyl-accepting chemotaxis protein [Fischerella sp. CENA71]|nr:methyl-accepting chemotaxis protein [Fischerella sp. CENA71]
MVQNVVTALLDQNLKQTIQVTNCLESLDQIVASIESVAESAEQAATLAKIASSDAKASSLAMESTVSNNLKLHSSLTQIVNRLKFLNESSQQIFPIISIINQISLQINVLAVNTSVEASRIGRSGQAFAKIAEQITLLSGIKRLEKEPGFAQRKALRRATTPINQWVCPIYIKPGSFSWFHARSNQATQSTKEIEKNVENIYIKTLEIVNFGKQAIHELLEETEITKQTQCELRKIVDTSNQMDELLESISVELEFQQKNSQILGLTIKQVAQDLLQSNKYFSSSERRTEAANALQQLVEVFKIDVNKEQPS